MKPLEPKNQIILTDEEKKAIRSLKRLAKNWPPSLWLFSGSGSLCVMKKGPDGNPVMKGDRLGPDQAYSITVIDGITNDGGDW